VAPEVNQMSKGTEFVNNWLDAVNRGDLDMLVGMCQPDVELSNPDGVSRGAEGVRIMFKPIVDAFSERQSQVSNIVESGDTVVAEFVFSGKHTGPLASPQGAVPPTGKTISFPMIGIYQLRSGKLANSRGQYDRLAVVSQLGLLGAPTGAVS
jgi:steroid delta-isomerase-like uncharacterized protein